MRRTRRATAVGVVVVATLALTGVLTGVAGADGRHHTRTLPQTCERLVTSVQLDSGRHDIAGELCWRGHSHGKTLQILTSGFTYDHTYWDLPVEPATYSWVEAATSSGYVTLNYDRLGIGDSDLPAGLPESLGVASQAEVLHQLVQDARHGKFSRTRFRRVVAVGHSMGSAISIYEAGTYGDVDALVLTGNMNTSQPDFRGVPSHPAVDDPKFAGSGLPDEVLTSLPGERNLFVHLANVDPAVAYLAEGLKATGVLIEVLTIPTAYAPDIAGNITVPVLIVVGQQDFLYCDTADGFPCDTPQDIVDRQAPMLPNAACVDAVVVPGAGHALNLHRSAPDTFAAVNTWPPAERGEGCVRKLTE